MSVENAKLEDIPRLAEMGEKFHAMSPHKGLGEYDKSSMARVLKFMIENDNCVVLANDQGLIGGTLSPVYFNPSILLMEENFWWASAGGQDLREEFEKAAQQMGAKFVLMSTLENEKADIIDRLMKRKGYRGIERRHLKELN